jgi:hypothetical protein
VIRQVEREKQSWIKLQHQLIFCISWQILIVTFTSIIRKLNYLKYTYRLFTKHTSCHFHRTWLITVSATVCVSHAVQNGNCTVGGLRYLTPVFGLFTILLWQFVNAASLRSVKLISLISYTGWLLSWSERSLAVNREMFGNTLLHRTSVSTPSPVYINRRNEYGSLYFGFVLLAAFLELPLLGGDV